MQVTELTVNRRDTVGKNESNRLRAKGFAPAMFYGKDVEPVMLAVKPAEFIKNISGDYALNTVFNLKSADGSWSGKALIKEIQRHPVKDYLYHVDFVKVEDETVVQVEVPIILEGKAAGVGLGGTLQPIARRTRVACKVKDIPVSINVDVTELGLGGHILASQITPPEGIKLVYKQDFGVATVLRPKGMETGAESSAPAPAPKGKK